MLLNNKKAGSTGTNKFIYKWRVGLIVCNPYSNAKCILTILNK